MLATVAAREQSILFDFSFGLAQTFVVDMKSVVTFLATAGMGRRIPRGAGTYGTLVAVPFVSLFWWTGPFFYMGFAVLLMVGAILVSQFYEDIHGRHDAKEVVIDEIAGFFVAMTWLPLTWQSFVVGFVIFRALDIFKPFPISAMDQKIRGGVGVVADDIAAGIVTNIIMQVLFFKTDVLGIRL